MLVIGYSWSDLSFNVYQVEIRMPVAGRVEDLITMLPQYSAGQGLSEQSRSL